MNSINNCMDGSRFNSQECCLLSCEKDVGIGLCQYANDLCFHASSLPCLHTFWHAIPTSLTFLMFLFTCFYTFLVLISVTGRPKSKNSIYFQVYE